MYHVGVKSLKTACMGFFEKCPDLAGACKGFPVWENGGSQVVATGEPSKMQSIEKGNEPFRQLRPPADRKDWSDFYEIADSMIDSTSEYEIVDVQVILDRLNDIGLGMTKAMLRERFRGDFDYVPCLRTFISLADVKWIVQDVVERIRNGEKEVAPDKYRDMYKEQEDKEIFDFCVEGLAEEICIEAEHNPKSIGKSKSTIKKSTGKKSTPKSTVKKSPGKSKKP